MRARRTVPQRRGGGRGGLRRVMRVDRLRCARTSLKMQILENCSLPAFPFYLLFDQVFAHSPHLAYYLPTLSTNPAIIPPTRKYVNDTSSNILHIPTPPHPPP